MNGLQLGFLTITEAVEHFLPFVRPEGGKTSRISALLMAKAYAWARRKTSAAENFLPD